MASGSTSIWYSRTKPPIEATSLTPSTAIRANRTCQDSERRVSLYQNTLIPKAEESLTATEAAFRADTADFLDLIDSQRVLLEFQLSRERALSDRLRAEAQIDRLIGRYVILPPRNGEEG